VLIERASGAIGYQNTREYLRIMSGRVSRVAIARSEPFSLLILVALVAAWSVPIAARMINAGDYPDHLRIAAAVAAAPHIPVPHFLYFIAVAAVMTIVPGVSLSVAGIVVTTGFLLATALVVWWYLRRTAPETLPAAAALLTLALLIVGPILPPVVNPDVFLIGFFVPNPYHNATIVAARPFAVALTICAAAALGRGNIKAPWWAAAGAVIASAVSKPNYLLCLVPALGIVAGAHLLTRRPVRWPLVLAILVPAAVLVWVLREAYGTRGVEVVVAPFAALRFHTAIDATLALKFAASVAFPLAVVMLWPRSLTSHAELALAWIALGIAVLQGILLAEPGPRIDHANLLAGASIATFVLMVTSCSAVLARSADRSSAERVRLAIAWTVFALHIWGGFRHVLVTMMTPERWLTPLGYAAMAITAAWLAVAARARTYSST
jgi:hypothetical protein